jgi:hypothetical protein
MSHPAHPHQAVGSRRRNRTLLTSAFTIRAVSIGPLLWRRSAPGAASSVVARVAIAFAPRVGAGATVFASIAAGSLAFEARLAGARAGGTVGVAA